MEQWTDSRTLYEGTVFSVRTGHARLDDGTIVHREMVEHDGGVGVVPVLEDRVILVRQFRIACGRDVIEIPAGRIEGDEDPAHRAQCELEEEVGYRAGHLIHVATCYPSPGFTNQMDYIYLAFDLEKTEQKLEHDERVELVEVPLCELAGRLANREFDDGKTIIGLRELLVRLDGGT